MPAIRSYAASRFQFTLDGAADTAYIKSVDGGYAKAEVVTEQIGSDLTRYKHVSTLQLEPLTLELGMSASSPIVEWISNSWQRKFMRKDGGILHADFNGKVQFEQWFYNALITETTIPALDAASNESVYLSVKIQPERIDLRKGKGDLKGKASPKQMMFTGSQFEVQIDGVDCSGINKVDSFTIKQTVKPIYSGQNRLPEFEPTSLEYPDITMECSLAFADDFLKWYETYVVKGELDTKAERDGAIIFKSQDGKRELLRVELKRMGMFSLQILKSEAGADKIKRAKIQFYVENMDIVRGEGVD